MPSLPSLLEVQEIDLTRDRLRERRRTLPERAALERNREHAATLDAAHGEMLERRTGLAEAEHELADEVAAVAAKAKEVDDTLYSGSVKVPKELGGLQEELRLLKQKQSELEEREMELLEAIEQAELEVAENRASRDEADKEADALTAAVLAAEGEIDAELATLLEQRETSIGDVPAALRTAYDRLRENKRLVGRAAALLDAGSCTGCRLKIPTHQYATMKAEPEDALLRCPHCSRVLVRAAAGE